MAAVGQLLIFMLEIYSWVLIMRVLISWVSPDPYNPIVQFLIRATEPVLEPLRRMLPSLAGLDFSPIIALMGVMLLQRLASVLFLGQGGFGSLLAQVLTLMHLLVTFYLLLVLTRAGIHFYTWFKYRRGRPVRINLYHPFNQFIFRTTEPAIRPLRTRLPTLYGLDISPLVAVLILILVLNLLQNLLIMLGPASLV
jgi:YggT family protein